MARGKDALTRVLSSEPLPLIPSEASPQMNHYLMTLHDYLRRLWTKFTPDNVSSAGGADKVISRSASYEAAGSYTSLGILGDFGTAAKAVPGMTLELWVKNVMLGDTASGSSSSTNTIPYIFTRGLALGSHNPGSGKYIVMNGFEISSTSAFSLRGFASCISNDVPPRGVEFRIEKEGGTSNVRLRSFFWDNGFEYLTQTVDTNMDTKILDGKWHHIVFQVLDSDRKIYVDGDVRDREFLDTENSSPAFSTFTDPFILGNTSEGVDGDPWGGCIDEVALYVGLLTDAQVKSHFLQGGVDREPYEELVKGDSPSVYLPLDEESGTLAEDISGNGNNGTHYNGVTVNRGGAF